MLWSWGAYDHMVIYSDADWASDKSDQRASLEVLLYSTEVQYHGQARSKRQYQHRAVNQSTLLSQHVLSKVNGSPNCFGT
jgi:hypothetical protein